MEISKLGMRDLIPGICWLVLGILVVVGSYGLGFGILQSPGPGMFPLLLGIILLLLSFPVVVYGVRDIWKREKGQVSMWRGIDFKRLGLVVVILLVYGLILERVGFSVTALLCLFFLYKLIGGGKTSRILVLTVVTVISAYLLFVVALNCYMPQFPWRDLLSIFY